MAMGDEHRITAGERDLPVEQATHFSGDPFGDFIRQRRVDLGLSLRDIERRTGIDNARVSRWERGHQRPQSADLLAPLATALEVPLADLCQRAEGHLTKGLPHLNSYLHVKYGHNLPAEVLHELVAHCEDVLNHHGIHTGEANAA